MSGERPIRVAVVGSGMAGLATAHLLSQDSRKRYQVEVFEKGIQLSLDSASYTVRDETTGKASRIDLPMRAFTGGFYPNLIAMYKSLGIRYDEHPLIFAFSRPTKAVNILDNMYREDEEVSEKLSGMAEEDMEQNSAYYTHATNLHQYPPKKPAQMSLIGYLSEVVYIAVCYVWFTICIHLVDAYTTTADRQCETLGEYVHRIGLPAYFVTYYLLPMLSTVATCPHEDLLRFPASDVITYRRRTFNHRHYTVSNGVQEVQTTLSKGLDIHLSRCVTKVTPCATGVHLAWEATIEGITTSHEQIFDRVVLAVTPNVVGKIFAPLRSEVDCIPVLAVENVVHTDDRYLRVMNASISTHGRKSKMAHRSNHYAKQESDIIHLHTTVGADEALTESVHAQLGGTIVNTRGYRPIDAEKVIQKSQFTRVLRTPASREVVNRIFSPESTAASGWRDGDDGVSLVGAWCWDGMVLLEGCIVSAMRVADRFEVEIPWW